MASKASVQIFPATACNFPRIGYNGKQILQRGRPAMKSIMDTVDSLFKYDSPFMLRASRVAGLIRLNLLWLVCCIPVFTVIMIAHRPPFTL